jgi:hypothetical protein
MATAVAPQVKHAQAALAKAHAPVSLARRFGLAMTAALVVVFILTLALILTVDVPVFGAFGIALFLTFWLGGGFGLIFGGAAMADHLHD